jgi:hypothetical protein
VDRTTELVMPINHGNRLFAARFDPLAFADQRWICLDPREGVDVGLCHALLNSAVSMFLMEGMGFGRGLGALDLNSERINTYFHMLDPNALDQAGVQRVQQAFAPLIGRDVLAVADELEQADRQRFDETVLEAFGLGLSKNHLYESLQALMAIRQAATS